MAVTVFRQIGTAEQIDLRSPSASLEYFARADAADRYNEQAIRDAVNTASPYSYYGLTKTSIRVRELGSGVNTATVEYRLLEGQPQPGGLPGVGSGQNQPPPPTPKENDPLNETFSFKVSAATQHVTQSLRTVSRTRRALPPQNPLDPVPRAPDYKGAIGVTKDRLEGCDVPPRGVSTLEWSYTISAPAISHGYLKRLARMVGTTNKYFFFHHADGEVLFLAASGQTKGPEGVSITYEFAVSPNLTDVEIVPNRDPVTGAQDPKGGLTVPSKRGWEYLWVAYEPNTSEFKATQEPLAAYVEQVLRESDFNDLGIGGGG
jgi:hypothetical protein